MTDRMTQGEMAESFGWVSALIDKHREYGLDDDALAMALLSAGATLLLPRWGLQRVGDAAAMIVRENALAIAQTRGVQ